MLQTNADIVSGDSGGPLANSAGQVIGMDTANASSSQGSSSVLGYAIPIDTALSVAHQIAAGQASATVQIGLPGFLGVLVPQSSSASPQQQAQQQRQQIQQQQQSSRARRPARHAAGNGQRRRGTRRAPTTTRTPRCRRRIAPASSGALVDGVLCGTAAAAAGIVSGDVITTVNGAGDHHPGFADRDDVRVPAGQQGDPPLGNAERPAADGHPHAERRAGASDGRPDGYGDLCHNMTGPPRCARRYCALRDDFRQPVHAGRPDRDSEDRDGADGSWDGHAVSHATFPS